MPQRRKGRKGWVRKVHTDSTHPPRGLFTKSASTIARVLATRKVSPKGPQSGMRMLNYYVNRAGRNLPASRKAVLERAKALLTKRLKKGRKRAPRRR